MTNTQVTPSLHSLIDAFIAGDTRQYRVFCDQITGYVNSYRDLSRELKEDIVAETIAALLHNFRTGRFRGDSIKALNVYIFRIVRNMVFAYRRKAGNCMYRIDFLDVEDSRSPLPDVGMANKDLITKILSQIEGKCASLLTMKFRMGMSDNEVAEQMAMTKNATSTAISRCLDRIKKMKIIKELV